MDVLGGSGGGGLARSGRALFEVPGTGPQVGGGGDTIGIAHRATEELRAAAALMADAQRVANFGSWEWRLRDDAVSWSDQLYRIFGIDPAARSQADPVTLETYLERVHPEDRQAVQAAIEGALANTRPFRFDHRIIRPTGEERAVRCQGEPVLEPQSGKMVRLVGVCQDVSELVLSERARIEADARFRSAFANAPSGMALVDFSEGADGRLIEVNNTLCELTGHVAAELIGRTLTSVTLAEDAELDLAQRERLLTEGEGYSVEKRALVGGDRIAWLQLNVSIVQGAGSEPGQGIVQVQDVTERKRFEEQLRHTADHDSLTGLMNRRRFREELDSQIALTRRYGGEGAVLLIDVDHLKTVNDTRGHGAGDAVLCRVAEVMRARVRSTDAVARLAGDEFAALLPNTAAADAARVSETLIARLADEEVAGWELSVSIGVARYGEQEADSSEDVMAAADAAMYRAKQRGGAVTEPAPPASPVAPGHGAEVGDRRAGGDGVRRPRHLRAVERATDPQELAGQVRSALEAEQLVLYGQPAIDLRNGQVAHRELLVRMPATGSDRVLAASEFLAAAAQLPGLCPAIDRWVVRRAIEMLGNGARGSRLQVNLSGETLSNQGDLAQLADEVAAAKLAPGSLALEIGEASIRREATGAGAALRRLGATGCPLVLDGFTAGFGSFEYLQRLPLEQIKIDGIVVRALLGEQPDHATVRAIVRLAHGTGKTTVAKLVESEALVPILRMHGVDMAQGFELGQPEPVAA